MSNFFNMYTAVESKLVLFRCFCQTNAVIFFLFNKLEDAHLTLQMLIMHFTSKTVITQTLEERYHFHKLFLIVFLETWFSSQRD